MDIIKDLENDKYAPAMIIAEVSANHNGEISNARALVESAASAGATAVKFQSYSAESLAVNATSDYFKISENSIWASFGNTFSLYQAAQTPTDWLPELFELAHSLGLLPFSTPFDEESVDALEEIGCSLYKVASPEINHVPLIRRIGKTGKPVIFSLGVASEFDVRTAVKEFRAVSKASFALLQCDTRYPATLQDANLLLLTRLKNEFGCIVGVSDHTIGVNVASTAVGLGAKIFEKHICLAEGLGIDSEFSLTPVDFKEYVKQIRTAELMLGEDNYRYSVEDDYRIKNSRSVFASADIEVGDIITKDNTRIVRPGYGLSPILWQDLLGLKAKRYIRKGSPLLESDLA